MAIYHLSHGMVSRSSGRSAVQSVAYITGSKIQEERRGLTANYQNRASDVIYTETLAPEGAPDWARDVHRLWNRLENFEDSYADSHYKTLETQEKYKSCAQTAMTIVVALPRELSSEVSHELVREFAHQRFVSRGLIVTYAIHDDEGNPHAHLQISRRSFDEEGQLSSKKDREICKKSQLKVTRKLWADLTNRMLEKEGFEARITEKSFLDLGIQLLPTHHRGWYADQLAGRGIQSRIVFENEQIVLDNRRRLLENPALILEEITTNQATFTQRDILRAIQKRMGDDDRLIAQVFEGALQASLVVGECMDGLSRYTSSSYKQLEENVVKQTEALATQAYSQNKVSEKIICKALTSSSIELSEEQQTAVRGLVGSQQLSVLVGRAGAGKTTTLRMVADVYQRAGHQVIGTSLAALAAENLENEAKIPSHTLQSWLVRWKAYEEAQEKFLSFNSIVTEGVLKQLEWYQHLKRFERYVLTNKHVVIVDEAGMVGTRQWQELQHYVIKSEAKLIAVGDDHQFKPIEAGDFFREILDCAERAGSLSALKDIRRQKLDWMKEASLQLSRLDIQEALRAYEQQGHIHGVSQEDRVVQIAKTYVKKSQTLIPENYSFSFDRKQFLYQQGLVLAYTHRDCHQLNQAIRQKLKEGSFIAPDDAFVLKGKGYALGDTIVFLKNDKKDVSLFNEEGVLEKTLFIKNGDRGKIRSVNRLNDQGLSDQGSSDQGSNSQNPNWRVTVELLAENGVQRFAMFDTAAYESIDHGYALTLHKAQGQTVDFTLIAASRHMDAKALYVALTRHRYDAQLYYDHQEFSSYKALALHLSWFQDKDLVKDYTIRPGNEEAHQRVQAYKLAALDAAAILQQRNTSGEMDWHAYQEVKSEQKQLGREILREFTSHRLYVHQAGLTKESLQISVGLKARPLSRAEEVACKRVELYCETALEARIVWNTIKNTSSGSYHLEHEQYSIFQQLRDQRDQLATEILENEPLHREFFQVIAEKFGYGRGVLQKQAAAFRQKQLAIVSEEPGNGNHASDSKNNGQLFVKSQERVGKVDHKETIASLKDELKGRIKDLAFELFGKPTSQTAREWRYGKKGSISVHIAGTKQGLYSNFETDTYGNAFKLIQDHFGFDSKRAFQWGAEWLGQESEARSQKPGKYKTSIKKVGREAVWTPIFPAPSQFLDLRKEKQLVGMLYGKQETARFTYKDAEENILGYVVRLEDSKGVKTVPTLTYCRNEKGEEQWRWKGFGDDRPLYGLEQLAQKPEARVLVVEGEKTAAAAKALFPDYAVVTWSGGCGAVHKSDWSVLTGREVIIWPDHDEPGNKAAEKIVDILRTHGIEKAPIVELPSTLPYKWDLADSLPIGWDQNQLYDLLKSASYSFHLTIENREEQERSNSIMAYMKQEVCLEKHFWLDDEQISYFLKGVENNPYECLRRWQNVSEDYSFRPLTKGESDQLQEQAQQLFISAQQSLSKQELNQLVQDLPSHAEGIVKKCQSAIQAHYERQRDLDVSRFLSLSEKCLAFSQTHSDQIKERGSFEKTLREMTKLYENDEKFFRKLQRHGSPETYQMAKDFLKEKPLQKEPLHPKHNRGFEL